MTELELTMRQLECGNLQAQERHQLAKKLVDLVRADVLNELIVDTIPHCADCIKAWSRGVKYTIDFPGKESK